MNMGLKWHEDCLNFSGSIPPPVTKAESTFSGWGQGNRFMSSTVSAGRGNRRDHANYSDGSSDASLSGRGDGYVRAPALRPQISSDLHALRAVKNNGNGRLSGAGYAVGSHDDGAGKDFRREGGHIVPKHYRCSLFGAGASPLGIRRMNSMVHVISPRRH